MQNNLITTQPKTFDTVIHNKYSYPMKLHSEFIIENTLSVLFFRGGNPFQHSLIFSIEFKTTKHKIKYFQKKEEVIANFIWE